MEVKYLATAQRPLMLTLSDPDTDPDTDPDQIQIRSRRWNSTHSSTSINVVDRRAIARRCAQSVKNENAEAPSPELRAAVRDCPRRDRRRAEHRRWRMARADQMHACAAPTVVPAAARNQRCDGSRRAGAREAMGPAPAPAADVARADTRARCARARADARRSLRCTRARVQAIAATRDQAARDAARDTRRRAARRMGTAASAAATDHRRSHRRARACES